MRRLLVLVVVAGCTAEVAGIEGRDKPSAGPETPGDDVGQTSITVAEYFNRIASVHCNQAFMCRSSFPEAQRGYPFEAEWGNSVPECIRDLIDYWDLEQIETEIAKGRIVYDGTAAVTCLDGVTFAECPLYWQRGIEWAESCYYVIVGQVQPGESCLNDYSCTTFYCEQTTLTCQ